MSDFKFKDYCPQIFRQLREWFRISTQEYLVTICGDFKLLEFISNSKSGQFFFFSHNSQFIIKTMTRTESIFLRKILPSYFQYVSQQPDTLLPKFYGMHRVKRKKQKIYFLIQQNVFYSDVDDIHDQYDLKVLSLSDSDPLSIDQTDVEFAVWISMQIHIENEHIFKIKMSLYFPL